MSPILVWNSKCLHNDLYFELDRGMDRSYPELSSNFKCPFNCILTSDRKLYLFIKYIAESNIFNPDIVKLSLLVS